MFCNFYLLKSCNIAKNSAVTDAREKINADFESLKNLMYVLLNLKTIKFYLIKLATDFTSYLVVKRASLSCVIRIDNSVWLKHSLTATPTLLGPALFHQLLDKS
jgi:hypothetical protein